jgi:exodeoxyribonuclease VII small subunit
MTASKGKKSLTFEEAFKELEAIAEKLEQGEISLDESMKAFEKGMELAQYCSEKLNEAESKLLKLVKKEGQGFQLELDE